MITSGERYEEIALTTDSMVRAPIVIHVDGTITTPCSQDRVSLARAALDLAQLDVTDTRTRVPHHIIWQRLEQLVTRHIIEIRATTALADTCESPISIPMARG